MEFKQLVNEIGFGLAVATKEATLPESFWEKLTLHECLGISWEMIKLSPANRKKVVLRAAHLASSMEEVEKAITILNCSRLYEPEMEELSRQLWQRINEMKEGKDFNFFLQPGYENKKMLLKTARTLEHLRILIHRRCGQKVFTERPDLLETAQSVSDSLKLYEAANRVIESQKFKREGPSQEDLDLPQVFMTRAAQKCASVGDWHLLFQAVSCKCPEYKTAYKNMIGLARSCGELKLVLESTNDITTDAPEKNIWILKDHIADARKKILQQMLSVASTPKDCQTIMDSARTQSCLNVLPDYNEDWAMIYNLAYEKLKEVSK